MSVVGVFAGITHTHTVSGESSFIAVDPDEKPLEQVFFQAADSSVQFHFVFMISSSVDCLLVVLFHIVRKLFNSQSLFSL